MKNEVEFLSWKRLLVFASIIVVLLLIIDRVLLAFKGEEVRTRMIMDELQTHKVLSNELHTLFHGMQDDFKFFEKKINDFMRSKERSTAYHTTLKTLVDFLDTHPGYFKVRVTNSEGKEIFKIVQNTSHTGYYYSSQFYNLSQQNFYKELAQVKDKQFYFSSMDPNIINGVIESPIRPTVRVAKKIKLPMTGPGLLIFNIDGKRILDLFSVENFKAQDTSKIALVDGKGLYVANFPSKGSTVFSVNKASIGNEFPVLTDVISGVDQGKDFIMTDDEIIVHSSLLLPKTTMKWFIVSRIPKSVLKIAVGKERLTWILWEVICLAILMTWFWKDEKKRHKDQVVKVLLKERSEFIQNVSHQLKTPLAIMINSLDKKVPNQEDWAELKKEMNYLIKVVEDMLLLAQVDTLKDIPLKKEDILEIVNDAIDLTGPKAREKDVQIRFNVDNKVLSSCDKVEKVVMGELLKSAIVNILDNAIDFSGRGGLVDVLIADVDSKTVIRIKDNGPGVPDEFVPHLFKRFSRVRSTRKGSGLGLSIAKKIIDLHNGEIFLISNSNGATFEIRL